MFAKIKNVTCVGKNSVYYAMVEKNQNFFANGMCVHNCGYTGEVCVIITNTSNMIQTIDVGERIAQLVPCMVALPQLVVGNIGESSDGRGEGGFNSTGTK